MSGSQVRCGPVSGGVNQSPFPQLINIYKWPVVTSLAPGPGPDTEETSFSELIFMNLLGKQDTCDAQVEEVLPVWYRAYTGVQQQWRKCLQRHLNLA